MKSEKSAWLIVNASVEGKSHVNGKIPCQDAHGISHINANWGIAVVSDGAGSHDLSHFGSAFVVKTALVEFKKLLVKNNWHKANVLPDSETWDVLSKKTLRMVRDKLLKYSYQENVDFKSLSCTVIVLIFSPLGLMVTHIGDGRAGYCDENDQWLSMITPFSGYQVGTTWFITNDIWDADLNYIESNVINDGIKAFTLLTDGCELSCWECYQKSETEEIYSYPNKPFKNFFDPNVKILLDMHNQLIPHATINEKWRKFITSGNEKLMNEPDDKTLILGVLIPKTGKYA